MDFMHYARPFLLSILTGYFVFMLPSGVHADIKTIVMEATYTMGDGETPSFAEAMVLQRAKQAALEQAGMYVESYTHVRNLDVTVDEIRTIAGGVMETEVIEKNRLLLKEGGERFFVKIKARITTDKIEDLVRRVKGTDVAEENKRVLEAYAKINADLEALKKQIVETRTEAHREMLLEKIRDVEREFRHVKSTETALYKQLLSGQALSEQVTKALAAKQKQKEEDQRRRDWQNRSLIELLGTLQAHRYKITIDSPETDVRLEEPGTVILGFPVTVQASDEMRAAIKNFKRAYAGDTPSEADEQIEEALKNLSLSLVVGLSNGTQYRSGSYPLRFKSVRSYDLDLVLKDGPARSFIEVEIPRQFIQEVSSVEGIITGNRIKSH